MLRTGNMHPYKKLSMNVPRDIFHDSQKSPMDEGINKMWYNRTIKYYSTIKRNEVRRHAGPRRNLENIMMSGEKLKKDHIWAESIPTKCLE